MAFNQESIDDAIGGRATSGGGASPGKMSTTSRLAPRAQQIVFRVESAEAAAVFAERFGPRDDNGVAAGAAEVVDRAAAGNGAPLPAVARDRFESSLGADLSSVRVHTGAASADAAGAVGARAYTVGNDIHFGAGQYAPDDPFGLHLLAHEVAHTQQQAGAAPTTQFKLEVSSPNDAAEVEADRAADAMVHGAPAAVSSGAGVARAIHRKAGKSEFGTAGGSAGVMDQMAAKASAKVDQGLPAIAIDTKHAVTTSSALAEEAQRLSAAKVPGSIGLVGEDNPAVKAYQQESGRYLTDLTYIAVAQNAYDPAIGPTVAAAKDFAALRSIGDSLGLVDEKALGDAGAKATQLNDLGAKDVSELGSSLSAKQKQAFGDGVLGKEDTNTHTNVLAKFDQDISTAQSAVTTAQRNMISASLDAQRVVLTKLKDEQKKQMEAKGEEKTAIENKIKAIVNAAENVGKIAKMATGIGLGPDVLVEGVAKGALEYTDAKSVVDKGAGVLGTVAGEFAEAYYAAELTKIKTAIGTAQATIEAAGIADLVIAGTKASFDMETHAGELVAKLQALAFAKANRKHYLAVEAKAADQKHSAGDKNKDSISQMALAVAAAGDASTSLRAASDGVNTAIKLVGPAHGHIEGHREVPLPGMKVAPDGHFVVGKDVPNGSSNDPDTKALYQIESALEAWTKTAAGQQKYVSAVQSAAGSIGPKKAD